MKVTELLGFTHSSRKLNTKSMTIHPIELNMFELKIFRNTGYIKSIQFVCSLQISVDTTSINVYFGFPYRFLRGFITYTFVL